MQSSEGVKNLLHDQHLLNRPRPSTSFGNRSRTTRPSRPISAPPSRPPWRNPSSPETKRRRKFNVSLYHTPFESSVSRKAPYASRAMATSGSTTFPGKEFSSPGYNSLSDPHLNEFFTRKFGFGGEGESPARRKVKYSASGQIKKQGANVLYKVMVKTGSKKNCGTDAKVFCEFSGVHGKFRRQLTHQVEAGVPAAFVATLSPFVFSPGAKDLFNIKGSDIGEMRHIVIEHDGKDRKQGWFLEEVTVLNNRSEQKWSFPCNQWLSLYEQDCAVSRKLKAVVHRKPVRTVYVIEVETGDKAGAGTDAHVFITLYGKNGKTPKTQLINRNENTFERKRTDVFKIKITELGPLSKLTVEHDNFGFSAGWYLNKITVYERDNPDKKYYFPCNQWLATDEGDGRIVRNLTASTDPKLGRQEFTYLVHAYTGDKRGAGTDANVTITVFGHDGDTGEHKLDNARNNFERAKKDTFKISSGTYLGDLTKVRVGHDNSGLGPGWFLEKITVEDSKTGQLFDFMCRRWLSRTEDDGQITRELVMKGLDDMAVDKGIPYEISITTGDLRNAGTDARVYVIIHGGEDGNENSGKIWLDNGNKDNFKRGRTDIFQVETTNLLSPLHHLTMGHDNSGIGSGFYCEKVVVDCASSGYQQMFLCQKWLADDEDDNLIERDLYESEDMRIIRGEKEVWNVGVWTSDKRGAGTDANVFVTVYGKKGKSEEIPLGNRTDNFEEGQMDKFKVEMPKIGKLYKLRIRHDNHNAFPGWHLEKVQMQHANSNTKYSFKCDRWLSKDEDDHQIIRELPAFGPDIEPLPVYTYRVFLHTGNKRGAGTDADVFITIFGEMGDTGERPLETSKDNTNKFERNQIDEFEIEAVSLAKLKKIRIGHNGKGTGSAWYLDKVVISDPEESTKVFEFPCERWLAKDEDDGLTTRELLCGKASLLNTTSYHVSVRTGDMIGAGTDANVYVILHGDQGDTGKLNLKQAINTKNKFERARTDQFKLEAVNIGKIQKLLIGHDNKGGGAAWFLEDVVVDIPSRGERAVFPCHRWLAEKEDDGRIERDLYPTEIQQTGMKIPYEAVIHTGDVRGAGTNANVVMVLYGEKGKSEEFSLRNKSDNFERNQVDKFKVECDDIGPLTKIRIGHDNTRMGSAWFLDKVEIRRIKPDEEETKSKKKKDENVHYDYLFVCNRWLAKDEDDGQTMRELVPMDSTGSRPLNDALSENTYRIHVYTGDVSSAGTNSNVFLTLYGELGDSGERKMDKSETHLDKFERANEDIFSVLCVNLGPLTKAKIRHDNSGLKSAWNLDRIEVEDKLAGKTTAFPCGRWLATSEDDGQICRELVAVDLEGFQLERQRSMKRRSTLRRKSSEVSIIDGVDLESKARTTTYEVTTVTGDVRGAGTDANVYIVLYGTEGDTGKIPLKTSSSNKNKFERNQSDVFNIDAKVGEVKKIRISHDNKGGFAGWFLDKVVINVPSLGQHVVFPCGRWLDKDKDDGKLERELSIAEDSAQVYRPHVPYEITVYTSDKQGAGTSANVFIVLCGVEGSTKEIILADTNRKKKGTFDKGSVDQFVKELDDIGPVIEKIRIGHDNKGLGAGWHLEKVEVRRLSDEDGSSTTHTFPCNNWLAKGEGDGAIVRELVPQKVVEETVGEDGELETKEVDQYTLEMHKYELHVFTGDVKNAGTDANVFITIFGEYSDSGERQLSKSSTHSDKFERGHEDVFNIEAADLGNVHKIKLRHDNKNLNASWFVNRIEIRDLETDKVYPFIIERWLSKKKEDQKIERTFYVKGYEGDRSTLGGLSMRSLGRDSPRSVSPSGSPRSSRRSFKGSTDNLSVKEPVRSATADKAFAEEYGKKEENAIIKDKPNIPYTVRVTTVDQSDSGTDSKAYVALIGENGASDKIPLDLVQQDSFKPGLTETFAVEGVDVGKISKLEIGHDGYGPSSGWQVKDIEVDVPTEGTKYFFPCNRWLSRDKDDGKTSRILSASTDKVVTYKPHVQYEMSVYTGDVTSAGTDSKITYCLFGTEGATPEMSLEKQESRFERAVVDVIPIECEDVGKLVKMRVKIDGKGSRPSWFLEKVLLRNASTSKVDTFICNQWLSKSEGKLEVEIPCEAEKGDSKTLRKTTYTVKVKTGDVSSAGTDANVFIILFGQFGDCGELALKHSESFKDKFERNHMDIFVFKNIYSLGELSKVRIWHDNKFLGASWFLESVEVIDESTKANYLFPCKRWLSKDKDDKSLVRELSCSTGSKISMGANTVYEITILTSDKQNAGTTQNASIILEGENGSSKTLSIENSAAKKVLRRGQTDNFSMKSKQLGELTHMTLDHVKKRGATVKGSGKETAWFVHEVIVQNEETGKFVFPCRQWIPLGDGRDDNSVRLECKTSEKPRLNTLRDLQPVQYSIDVHTADVQGAGTDANVHITMYGSNGDTGRRPLTKKFVDLFERGKKDSFSLEALDLGSLSRVRIEHDNKGFKAGWMLAKVDITNTISQECVTFPCNQWLDKKKGDGKICRDLFPQAS